MQLDAHDDNNHNHRDVNAYVNAIHFWHNHGRKRDLHRAPDEHGRKVQLWDRLPCVRVLLGSWTSSMHAV